VRKADYRNNKKNRKGALKMKRTLLFALAMVMAISFGYSSSASAATTLEEWTANSTSDFPGSMTTAADPTGLRAGGIVWSRHNLSAYGEHLQAVISTVGAGANHGGDPDVHAPATTQVCVFCHTPHHGRTDTAPLWNRGSAAVSYTPYSATLAGTSSSLATGSSLACLSCHDGVTTIDNLINRPGKGSGSGAAGASDQGWTFTEKDTDILGPSVNRLNIGTDMTNDHPMGIVYESDGRASLRPTGTTISSLSMAQANTVHGSGNSSAIFGRSDNYWAIFGSINGTATIAALLRNSDKVECASCHDPHYRNQTNSDPSVACNYYSGTANVGTFGNKADCLAEAAAADLAGSIGTPYQDYVQGNDVDGLFLRRVGGNSNSGVCRTCHAK
jgi:hypothetical protein